MRTFVIQFENAEARNLFVGICNYIVHCSFLINTIDFIHILVLVGCMVIICFYLISLLQIHLRLMNIPLVLKPITT